MPRYFTHYWQNQTWERNRSYREEGVLDYIAGNLFEERGVRAGDIVYVVTAIKGALYMCGKLIVGRICDVDKAIAILDCEASELWPANEYVIAAAATPMNFNLRVSLQLTRRLRFISGNGTKLLTFKSPNHLDPQTLRGVRELDRASAAELDKLLPNFKEISFDKDEDTFPPLDEETLPEEIVNAQTYYEGATKHITVNVYERNAKARKACIAYYGVSCFICGFNFKSIYGQSGAGFIHVHHLKPLAEIGREYKLDPIKDLRPVCPNCHAMIHKRVPAYTIEEMQDLLVRKL